MKDKLIVIAGEEERRIISDLPPLFFDIPVLVTGIGAINVIRTLQTVSPHTGIINIGYAGSKNIPVGTKVEISEVRLNHPSIAYDEPTLPLLPLSEAGFLLSNAFPKVICYSATDFVTNSDYDNCVFDMELAYIAALGFKVSAIKVVSDNLSHEAYSQYIQ